METVIPHLLDTVGISETPALSDICLSDLVTRVTAPIFGRLSTIARSTIPTLTSFCKLVDLTAEVLSPLCRNVRAIMGNPLLEDIV